MRTAAATSQDLESFSSLIFLKNLLKNNLHREKCTRAQLEFSHTAHVGIISIQVEKLNMTEARGLPKHPSAPQPSAYPP